jgi:hypothetical protein
MADDLDAFFTDLMQEVAASASAKGEFTRTALVENLASRLVESEDLQDWAPCYYDGRGQRNRPLGVDGYSVDELQLDGTLQVLTVDHREGGVPEVLNTTDVNAAFNRVANFVVDARTGLLHEDLEPSTPAADFARLIFESRGSIRTLRVLVLSNASLGARYRDVKRSLIDSMKVELHIWDLSRFHKLAGIGGREEIDIDVTSLAPDGLPALPAGIGNAGYGAYLCVVPGGLLADVYEEHGSRILEGNVRAFLSARGNVNKGIRKTILNRPDQFFAFNNGITATATKVETGPTGNIIHIRDLQIVNGGQTTASLYNARERDEASLDGVFVQMKLSVLAPDVALIMIPEISRYANTQNKVSEADLFANHPFNRKVEELSRQLWAPSATGSRQMTHWFYERARAQYQTEQIKLTPSQKKAFLLQNPKDQVITKTELAKFENTWRQLPHLVSSGAQKNFVKYAEVISEEYDARPTDFNERWFQHLVAKAILFTTTERTVSAAPWYTNAYRANIVTYAIARLNKLVEDEFSGQVLNLDMIWKEQRLSDPVVAQLARTAEAAHGILVAPPPGWSNVTEWAKKEVCWQRVAEAAIPPVRGLELALKAVDEEKDDRRRARGQAREDNVISAQVEVVNRMQAGFWARALAWHSTVDLLSGVELGILQTAVNRGATWVPSDAQAKRLMTAARKLEDEGFE